jgi:hypothetical protein
VHLEIATFLLQWSAGGLLFLWVTSRHRIVGLGYGWLLRSVYGSLAALGLIAGFASGQHGAGALVRAAGSIALVVAALVALVSSIVRRRAGVSGLRAQREHRAARVAAMIGRSEAGATDAEDVPRDSPNGSDAAPRAAREFEPALDLLAPLCGLVGLVGAAAADGGAYPLTLARFVIGAVFLGVISDAMLLGHWYLVQPGLSRDPIKELVRLAAWVWPFEVLLMLWPPGIGQVFTGAVDDGYGGLLGWIWAVCAVSTITLVGVTWLALRERFYSAVMAATGLLYLAILTGFGTDLLVRAVLNP